MGIFIGLGLPQIYNATPRWYVMSHQDHILSSAIIVLQTKLHTSDGKGKNGRPCFRPRKLDRCGESRYGCALLTCGAKRPAAATGGLILHHLIGSRLAPVHCPWYAACKTAKAPRHTAAATMANKRIHHWVTDAEVCLPPCRVINALRRSHPSGASH